MKYILIFLMVIGFSCKQLEDKPIKYNKGNVASKNDSIKPTNTKINYTKASQVKICTGSFRRPSAPLNKFMASKKITYHDSINESALYSGTPQVFDSLFQAQSINCILSSSVGPYLSFELFYDKSIKAENIYDDLFTHNKNYESKQDIEGYYHDFFKRGLIFILNKKDNIITIINFNPFHDNSLPTQVRQYFSKNKNEFDNVFMSTGVKTAEEFVLN